MRIEKSFTRGMAALLLMSLSGFKSMAMTGTCYQDRRPGGCYEQAIRQENVMATQQKLYNEFLSAMKRGYPASAFPTFCNLIPDPRNHYATMAPAQSLTQEQMKTCIDASNKYMTQQQQKEQQQREAYEKESVWQKIEADNGAVYQVDIAHIVHRNGGATEVRVYAIEGGTYDPNNMTTLFFNCESHQYSDIKSLGRIWQYAPPRSVAGQIEAIACAEEPPKASDYCVGFSADACDRIKSVIEAKTPPGFCKSGFAMVGSALTSEQLRICYVMTAPGFH